MRERLITTFVDPKAGGDAPAPAACPYLGLANDAFNHVDQPSSDHRCYLWMQRERIDKAHQQRYCLTKSFSSCPWMAVHRQTGASEDTPWARLRMSFQERFDELERVTMRSSWPKAILALMIFLFQFAVLVARESRRLAGPAIVWCGHQLARASRWYWAEVHPILRRRIAQLIGRGARSAPTQVATASRREADVPAFQMASAPSGSDTPSGVAPSPIAEASEPVASPQAPSTGGRKRVTAASLGVSWECSTCLTVNSPSIVLCQRCGRLSTELVEELQARGAFLVLDGLKLMQIGDEEGANRRFARAVEDDPDDELAWTWRSRTAGSLDEAVMCLENLARLRPEDRRLQADLAMARARRQFEGSIPVAEPRPEPKPATKAGPSTFQRAVAFARRLSLELASIPAFGLGLLLFGQPSRDALGIFGLSMYDGLIPVFHVPALVVTLGQVQLGDAIPPGLIPATLDLGGLLPALAALWYLRLAFKVADGPPAYRHWAVISGLAALGGIPLILAGGYWYLICSLLLLVLGGIGQGQPSSHEQYYSYRPSSA